MSNFREKAKAIKAAGEAERGNFEPNGVPKRMYNYWLKRSRTERAQDIRYGKRRENFCHFWRVVAIWAPLMFLKQKIGQFFEWAVETRAGNIASIIFIVALLVVLGILTKGALPLVLLAIIVITAAIFALSIGIVLLFDNFWNRSWNKHVGYFFAGLAGLGVVGLTVFALVMLVIDEGWIALLGVFGIVAVVAVLVLGLSKLAIYISGKRALENVKEREAMDRYLNGEGPNPYEREPREPGRIQKFFSGVADFLILITQVVRVKKWKICPLVDISK